MNALRRNFPLRIAVIAAALQVLILLVVLSGTYVGVAVTVGRLLDNSLAYYGLLAMDADRLPGRVRREPGHEERARRSGVAFQTLVEKHAPTEREEDEDGEEGEEHLVPDSRPDWLQTLWPARDAVRVAYVRLPDGRVRLVAAPAGVLAHQMREIVRILSAVAAGAVPIAAFLVFWVAQRAFGPLRQVTAIAAEIGPASLDTRIHTRVAGEDRTVNRLVAVLNGMLDRFQAGFRAQARFADDASHELRTPLAALRAELEVALRQPRDVEIYRRVLVSVQEEVERLSLLTNDLLLLARHERGAVLPLQPDVPLANLVTRVDRELGALAQDAGVTVVTDVPDELALDCDPVALERVFSNLVRNAIQHSPVGGVVMVTARPSAAGVQVDVSDEGAGIPTVHLPHIFDRFYRGDAARRRGGTGLGLAIARSVVEAHGGTIGVENLPGVGTCFTVWIPKRQPGLGEKRPDTPSGD